MKSKLAIIGGGLREKIAVEILEKNGLTVFQYGLDKNNSISLFDCLKNADILFLPVRCNEVDGSILTSSDEKIKLKQQQFLLLKDNALIFGGSVSEKLKEEISKSSRTLIEYMEIDDIAIPNAFLTAEGALFEMMSRSLKSCREWKIGILGAGRVGKACAEVFRNIGAKVTVFCRKETDYFWGKENGYDMRYYSGLSSVSLYLDFVVNTVPTLIITENIMKYFNKDIIIIDLASVPGGVDFEAAEKMRLKASLLSGIPGKYAPVSAGEILGNYYLNEIKKREGGMPF